MAHFLCSYSSLDCKVSHFPLYNTARQSHHPIFDLTSEDLLAMSDNWVDGKFLPIDSYLYYLALFHATKLVRFSVPAVYLESGYTDKIVANNMYLLIKMASRIQYLGYEKIHNRLHLPEFCISPETKTLDNSGYWLKIWEENFADYEAGYRTTTLNEKLIKYENYIEKKIKNHDDIDTYAGLLSEWAALAGDFPVWDAGLDPSILKGKKLPLSEYWKIIIKKAATKDSIFDIPLADLNELIEHCEEELCEHGIYFHTLMALLREAKNKRTCYLELGNFDISGNYRILDASNSVEDANLLAIIDNAPSELPIESQYPSKLAYLKAKMAYTQAQAYKAQQESK